MGFATSSLLETNLAVSLEVEPQGQLHHAGIA